MYDMDFDVKINIFKKRQNCRKERWMYDVNFDVKIFAKNDRLM